MQERFASHAIASPMRAATQTASALGIRAEIEPALADIGHGEWAGRSFADLPQDAMGAWLANPLHGTPGGESMAAVRERVGLWLDAASAKDGVVLAITHATVIRAALAHALDLPLASTLSIDVAPLSTARLSFNRRWRLQSLGPVASGIMSDF